MNIFRQYYWRGEQVSFFKYWRIQVRRFWFFRKNRWLRKRMAGMSGQLSNGAEWKLLLPKENDPQDKNHHMILLSFKAPGFGDEIGGALLFPSTFKETGLEETFKRALFDFHRHLSHANLAMAEPGDPDGFFVKRDYTAKERYKYDWEKEVRS